MQNNSPLVSIIVPIYNVEKYLRKCLESILAQSYTNLEIILVDDGSTDESSKIIDEFQQMDTRIISVRQKNGGLSAARNTGLKMMTGNYVTFVDSDDEIKPNFVRDLLIAMDENEADIAVAPLEERFEDGHIKSTAAKYPSQVYNVEDGLAAMLQEKGFMLSTIAKMYKSCTLKNITFPVGKVYEDVGTTYKMFLNATKIVFIPEANYIYTQRKNSLVHEEFNSHKFDIIELTDEMCDTIDTHFETLKNITNERRMRARFSVLRQIPNGHNREKELLKYLKKHQDWIFKNPKASTKDKIALRLALVSPKIFKTAYRIVK